MDTAYISLKPRADKNGLHPLLLNIKLVDGRLRRGIGKRIPKKYWDAKNRCISRHHGSAALLNQLLAKKIGDANKIVLDFQLAERPLTKDKFWEEFTSAASRGDVLAYMRQQSSLDYERGQISQDRHRAELRTAGKMEKWHGLLQFFEIDRLLIERFDAWHKVQLQAGGYLGDREREKALKHIHKYLSRARADEIKFKWPFENFRWPKYKARQEFLSLAQLQQLMELYAHPAAIESGLLRIGRQRGMFDWNLEQYASESGVLRIRQVIRRFLVQCFLGVRYSDLVRLRWRENVREGKLHFTPNKTRTTSGEQVRMLLPAPVLRYAWPADSQEAGGYLIKPISNVNFNKYLKEVAQICGWELRLTTHVARHSFATLYLSRGGGLAELQRILGLKKLETLMVYVHITDQSVNQSIEKVFGEL